jgi:hypothetical protein
LIGGLVLKSRLFVAPHQTPNFFFFFVFKLASEGGRGSLPDGIFFFFFFFTVLERDGF